MYGYPDDTDPLERSHLAKLEIVVRDEEVDPVIDIILKHAQTGCTKNGPSEAIRWVASEAGISPR